MSKTNHGTTYVVVGDDKHELRLTLKAVKGIEARFGGLAPALHEVQKLSLGATAAVIAIGSGMSTKPKDIEALEEQIFDAGLGNVAPEVLPYLLSALNPAGKSDEEVEKEAAAGNE
ncbi:hypothetical protein 9F2_12 [uncultured Caudovirales phage]|uniref:Uncharacterized protein n=1 Tax=uncultured Caudovirales phage TaxID=2100421 RepID=A0A2H4JFP4_9CAUD|nr:hypothetical protein 9F2_12 [uncultured Caudovirales phage]